MQQKNRDIYGHAPLPWSRTIEQLYLYVLTPSTAFGVASADPQGATRWQFER